MIIDRTWPNDSDEVTLLVVLEPRRGLRQHFGGCSASAAEDRRPSMCILFRDAGD